MKKYAVVLALFCGLVVSSAASASPDLNQDGAVDLNDLSLLRASMFSMGPVGDIDGDGIVNFSDLALLRNALGGAGANFRGGNLNSSVYLVPDLVVTATGQQVQIEVWMDFTPEPTIGGGFDLVYPAGQLSFVSWVAEPLGDPAFSRVPDPFEGRLSGAAFGDFDGVAISGKVATVTFDVLADGFGELLLGTTDSVTGNFIAANANTELSVDYGNGDVIVGNTAGDSLVALPQAIDFGTILEGSVAESDIRLRNIGASTITISAVDGVQCSGAGFSVASDPCSGAILAPGEMCTVAIALTGTQTGPAIGNCDISSDDPLTPVLSIALQGNVEAVLRQILVTPLALQFGTEPGDPNLMRVTVSSSGNTDLSLGTVAGIETLEAPFSVVFENCSSQVLAPAAECTIDVAFISPDSGVGYADSFDIPSDDPVTPTTIVTVSGGDQAPTSAEFSAVFTGFETVTGNCINREPPVQVVTFNRPMTPAAVDCGLAGVDIAPDDRLVLLLDGPASSSGAAAAVQATGLQSMVVVCRNQTTGQSFNITRGGGSPDMALTVNCTTEGLIAAPGDSLRLIAVGSAYTINKQVYGTAP